MSISYFMILYMTVDDNELLGDDKVRMSGVNVRSARTVASVCVGEWHLFSLTASDANGVAASVKFIILKLLYVDCVFFPPWMTSHAKSFMSKLALA